MNPSNAEHGLSRRRCGPSEFSGVACGSIKVLKSKLSLVTAGNMRTRNRNHVGEQYDPRPESGCRRLGALACSITQPWLRSFPRTSYPPFYSVPSSTLRLTTAAFPVKIESHLSSIEASGMTISVVVQILRRVGWARLGLWRARITGFPRVLTRILNLSLSDHGRCQLPDVVPSTPLRGFVCLRTKLDGHAPHPSCEPTCCQGTIPSVMDGSGSDKWLVELWMAVLS